MTTHTPGEWRIEGDTEPAVVTGQGERLTIIAYLPYAYETTGWTDQNQADAHLIAAAPTMLTALQDILKMCGSDDAHIHSRAHAAIAKAKGEHASTEASP